MLEKKNVSLPIHLLLPQTKPNVRILYCICLLLILSRPSKGRLRDTKDLDVLFICSKKGLVLNINDHLSLITPEH